ncbi:MAG: hypothetical protein ACYTEY_18010, partial [Planctomycetota bacterium]
MSAEKTFVLVGHCWADRMSLKSAVKRAVPGATIARADDMASLREHIDSGAVLLVNRVLDGRFEAGDGVELIRELNAGDDPPRAILVSDYPEAQADAVAARARPGFGKAQLHDELTVRRLREVA